LTRSFSNVGAARSGGNEAVLASDAVTLNYIALFEISQTTIERNRIPHLKACGLAVSCGSPRGLSPACPARAEDALDAAKRAGESLLF
jgi:hypothetical protein